MTGVTEKLFMCQMFMCLFWPLHSVGDQKVLSIAKIHPKPSQEYSEHFGPFIHKIKGFGRNSPQKVHPNFAQNLGRRTLGNTSLGLNSGKEKTHKYKKNCRIVPGLGGWQRFLCVFFGSFLVGRKEHINKIHPKSRNNPRKILFMCFFFMCFFSLPIHIGENN